MRIGELIQGFDVRLADPGAAPVRICDITEDSRTVLPGSLYIARRGEKADGRDFVPAAIGAGAVAVLTDDPALVFPYERGQESVAILYAGDIELATALIAERFYGSPSSRLALIGVTGTNGKTTTTYLIHQALNALGIRCGLIGTICIDDGTEVAAASLTTPPALEISRTLARMLDAGCRAAVLEVSSHALIQKRVAGLAFDVAAFTNLTGDHLDYHRTMENYASAKSILFGSLKEGGVAVVNADDPVHARMIKGCRARVIGCSLKASAAAPRVDLWRGSITGTSPHGVDVLFEGPWLSGSGRFPLPFIGEYNVMNALEGAACVQSLPGASAAKLGAQHAIPAIDPRTLWGVLGRASLPPGRLECLTRPGDAVTVYVDYAHTDDALRTVLEALRGGSASNQDARTTGSVAPAARGEGSCTVVFGCGGDRDATKRARMGAVAVALADKVVITSDNPRTEDPRRIIDDILEGIPGAGRAKVEIEPDRALAIRGAIRAARAGDTILIAGKGHEDYQILPDPSGQRTDDDRNRAARSASTVTRFFDDRLVAQEALSLRGITIPPRMGLSALPRAVGLSRAHTRPCPAPAAAPRT